MTRTISRTSNRYVRYQPSTH